jgi:hypothetical protein
MGRAAAEAAGRSVCASLLANGCPGCAANACCCFAKAIGGGGGVFLATTCRLAIAAGGAATRPALAALAPNTLAGVGATEARALTDMVAICCALTATDAFATGCALTNACCGTTITAPCTLLFAYVMFVMVVELLMMVVLYTFVT